MNAETRMNDSETKERTCKMKQLCRTVIGYARG